MGRARKLLVGIGTGVAVALAMLTRRHMPEEHARRALLQRCDVLGSVNGEGTPH